MSEFWFYVVLIICLLAGLRSFISGMKREKRVLWLSINSVNQEHCEKYAATYNIILGFIILGFTLIVGSSYVLIAKLF